MSLTGYIGSIHHNMLMPSPANCKIVKVKHPIITNRELDLLMNLKYRGFRTVVIPMVFTKDEGLEKALEHICEMADEAVKSGGSYIVLSDRCSDDIHIPIPSVLAVSAVHQHLINEKLRLQTDIIVESGEPREVMHFALLFGYGANVINPYMAYAIIERTVSNNQDMRVDVDTAEHNYISSIEKGIMKIMSKMGIATLRSYRGCMLFEALGISSDVCNRYLGGTVSNIDGLTIKDIENEAIASHDDSMKGVGTLPDQGFYAYRKGGRGTHGYHLR